MVVPNPYLRLLGALLAVPAFCYDNGLGRTPPMGWNSWCTGTLLEPSVCNLVGNDPCSEGEVKAIADSMVANGMDKLGYEFLELDDCWSATARDASGQLQADAKKFPSGMASLADYVHARGLKLGLYTSVGDKTCKGDRPGSYGHYATDASTLVGWGVDMIKMDHCGAKGNGTFTDRQLYGEMSAALNATGRPVLFSLCSWGEQVVLEWGADVAAGTGEVDWDAFFATLDRTGYSGDLAIEREAGEQRVEDIITAKALATKILAG